MTGLPKLPGFNFSDPTTTRYHVSHSFDVVNGYRVPRHSTVGIGGKDVDANSVGYNKKHDPTRYDPSLIYGRVQGPTYPQFRPHYALYDQKCLTFRAFFKQTVVESPDEHYRIRPVNILYFLEDDTITVMEPFVRNCGFQQGRVVRRSRIPRIDSNSYYHWKDFNVGIDMCFNGIVFHTVDCDLFTKEYMTSQGIEINATEDMPPDPYILNREFKMLPCSRVTPMVDDKLRRFLEYDGKILRFYAVWDDRTSEYGDLRECIIFYYLADDTVAIKEVHKTNDGCDPYPLLLKRMKLAKNWKDHPINYPACYLEMSDHEVTEYYQPIDFKIGETIFAMGRRLLIYDCDLFTRNYYEQILKFVQGQPLKIKKDAEKKYQKIMPPHDGLAIGSVEDSLQNCFQTVPKCPRRDDIRLLLNANKFLRYTMEFDWVHPEDSIRQFILFYSLADSTIKIFEPPLKNSGIVGGKYLSSMLIIKPGSNPLNPEYYSPADFYIGGHIIVHGQRFVFTGADLGVYRYMQANPEKFSEDVINNIRNYMFSKGHLTDDIQDKVKDNEEKQHKEEIDAIGRKLKSIQTDREKCVNKYLEEHPPPIVDCQINEPILNKDKLPYDTDHKKYGIKPVVKECAYPIETGNVPSIECRDERPSVYPKEETLDNYYKTVLQKHDDACAKAAEYKKHHECLPGTENIKAKELTKYIKVSEESKPQESKINPCALKTVTFYEPPDKCKQDKYDVGNTKTLKTHCDCTQ